MRLDRIVEEFGEKGVLVEWRSFLLRPVPEPKPIDKFRQYTQGWLRAAAEPDAGLFTPWSTDEEPPSHSVPPALAGKAAARQGGAAGARYRRALMEHYFHRNHNITDVGNLVRVAEECDLDVDAFVASLRDPVIGREVIEDHNQAVAMGVNAVPTVVVDGKWKLTGSQPVAVYRELVERRLRGEALA